MLTKVSVANGGVQRKWKDFGCVAQAIPYEAIRVGVAPLNKSLIIFTEKEDAGGYLFGHIHLSLKPYETSTI
jgi:hypothetical protein